MFSFVPFNADTVIPSNGKLSIPVRFSPQAQGGHDAWLHLRLIIEGVPVDTTISLRGSSILNILQLVQPKINFKASLCISADSVLVVQNPFCDEVLVDTLWLTGSSAFQLLDSDLSQISLPNGASKAFAIRFSPMQAGGVTATLHLRVTINGVVVDTSIQLDGTGVRNTNVLEMPVKNLVFPPMPVCQTSTQQTLLINASCDSVLVEPQILPANGFVLVEPASPTWIAPGDTITVVVYFAANNVGKYSSATTLRGTTGGGTFVSTSLDLTAELIDSASTLSTYPSLVLFDSLLCNQLDSGSFVVSVTGVCDSVEILAIELQDPVNFRIISPQIADTTLAPGSSMKVVLVFDPKQEGANRTEVRIRYRMKNSQDDSTIIVYGYYKGGPSNISSDLSAIDFGQTTLCEELDSTIVLYNSGCDTLIVNSADVLGAGFRVLGSGFPIIIPPNASKEIAVETLADTLGGQEANSATISFKSNAENQLPPVTLSRSFEFAPRYDIGLFCDRSGRYCRRSCEAADHRRQLVED